MKKLVEFKNVKISLKGRVLFENISFSLYEGDKIMLTGENGSGKSLLLELLALGYSNFLADRYKGLIIEGEIIDDQGKDLLNPRISRKYSYISQTEQFYKNVTLKEYAQISCAGIGIDFDEKRFDELLFKFRLLEKKNKKIQNNLSVGECKIIHIITRIMKLKATDIFILDEPLNHLSFKNSKIFNDIILEEINRNPSLTILVVSHCKAISFVNKNIYYNYQKNAMQIVEYVHYDCFQ